MLKPLFGVSLAPFPVYPIMLIIAALSALIMLNVLMKKGGFSRFVKKRVRRSLRWSAVLALVFSNMANWLFHKELMSLSLYDRFAKGGVSFAVWIICFLGFAALFLRLYKLDVKRCIDVVIPPLLLATFFARIGCSLGGCCYGVDVTLFGTSFPLPVREVEAFFALILCIVLCAGFKGKRLAVYTVAYSAFRFVAEFFRGDNRGSLFGIPFVSPTQIIAIVVLFVVLTIIIAKAVARANAKKAAAKEAEKSEEPQGEQAGQETPGTVPAQPAEQAKETKKRKKYVPRPVNFYDPRIKNNPLRIIIGVFLSIALVIGVFVAYNPLNMRWVTNLKYSAEDKLDFLFAEGSRVGTAGESVSLGVIDASDKAPVVNSSEALSLLSSYDSWNTNSHTPTETKELSNGTLLYVFSQTVNGVPVFGKESALLVDENGKPLYALKDAANDTFSTEIIADNGKSDKTYRDYFKGNVNVVAETPYLYDSGTGLIPAKHLILIDDEHNGYGVLVSAENDRVLQFTSVGDAPVGNGRAGLIIEASEKVADYIEADETDEIKKASKKKYKKLSLENSPKAVESALCKAYLKSGLSADEFTNAIATTNEIAAYVPNLSEQLYADVFAQTVKQTAEDSGETEKKADKCADKVKDAFGDCGIKERKDEKTVSVAVKDKKETFKNTIGSADDVDVFKLSMEDKHSMRFTVSSDIGIDIEVYTSKGENVLTTYTSSEHEFVLYSEDGTDYVVKIKPSAAASAEWSKQEKYKLSVKSKEDKDVTPYFVNTTIYSISSAFDSSKALPFTLLFQGDAAYTAEQVAEILAIPGAETCNNLCAGCTGPLPEPEDYNKIVVLQKMLSLPFEKTSYLEKPPVIQYFDIHSTAVTEINCFRFIETEDGAMVKAKVKVIDSNGLEHNGYSFFRIQNVKEVHTFDFVGELAAELGADVDTAQKLGNALNSVLSDKYYITEVNTEELYDAFGDSFYCVSDDNGLPSLYDFWSDSSAENPYLKVFDEQAALEAGHSKDRVEEFAKYTIRHNIAYCEKVRDYASRAASAARSAQQGTLAGYQLYSVIDDPFGAIIDETDNFVLKAIYRVGKIGWGIFTGDITDVFDAVADEAMGDFVEDGINSYAEQLGKDAALLEETAQQYQKKIDAYKKDLSKYGNKYFWENLF